MERLTLEEVIKYIKEVVQKNRKNKEKNTIVIPNSFISSADCAEKYEQVAKWLKELKSYKDAEEQGLLVRLPCKVGDTVYVPTRNFISELRIIMISVDMHGAYFRWMLNSGIYPNLDGFSGSELNKTVFLNREEAEKKLEEMRK
jgi:hypothetical protein